MNAFSPLFYQKWIWTILIRGHVSTIICITELRNNPKAACTRVNTTEKGFIELFPPDLYIIL